MVTCQKLTAVDRNRGSCQERKDEVTDDERSRRMQDWKVYGRRKPEGDLNRNS